MSTYAMNRRKRAALEIERIVQNLQKMYPAAEPVLADIEIVRNAKGKAVAAFGSHEGQIERIKRFVAHKMLKADYGQGDANALWRQGEMAQGVRSWLLVDMGDTFEAHMQSRGIMVEPLKKAGLIQRVAQAIGLRL